MSANFIENEIINETENKNVANHDSNTQNKLENDDLKDSAENNFVINENSDETTPNSSQPIELPKESTEEIKENDGWCDILGSGGIMKKTIEEGKPDTRPIQSEKCTINYICSLEDGTIIETKNNYQFFLGESDVGIAPY